MSSLVFNEPKSGEWILHNFNDALHRYCRKCDIGEEWFRYFEDAVKTGVYTYDGLFIIYKYGAMSSTAGVLNGFWQYAYVVAFVDDPTPVIAAVHHNKAFPSGTVVAYDLRNSYEPWTVKSDKELNTQDILDKWIYQISPKLEAHSYDDPKWRQLKSTTGKGISDLIIAAYQRRYPKQQAQLQQSKQESPVKRPDASIYSRVTEYLNKEREYYQKRTGKSLAVLTRIVADEINNVIVADCGPHKSCMYLDCGTIHELYPGQGEQKVYVESMPGAISCLLDSMLYKNELPPGLDSLKSSAYLCPVNQRFDHVLCLNKPWTYKTLYSVLSERVTNAKECFERRKFAEDELSMIRDLLMKDMLVRSSGEDNDDHGIPFKQCQEILKEAYKHGVLKSIGLSNGDFLLSFDAGIIQPQVPGATSLHLYAISKLPDVAPIAYTMVRSKDLGKKYPKYRRNLFVVDADKTLSAEEMVNKFYAGDDFSRNSHVDCYLF